MSQHKFIHSTCKRVTPSEQGQKNWDICMRHTNKEQLEKEIVFKTFCSIDTII